MKMAGDNYGWENTTIEDEKPGTLITIRDQYGDAFPLDPTNGLTQMEMVGEITAQKASDAFPIRTSQWADTDGDGYGDNQKLGSPA